MNQIEFGQLCRPLNEKYMELFGLIPTPADYACNREQYIAALQNAVTEKRKLSEYLPPAPEPDFSKYDY